MPLGPPPFVAASAPLVNGAARRASEPAPLDDDLRRHLEHLEVERRLAPRTLAMYRDAFLRLQRELGAARLPLLEVQVHHVRRWAAQMHGQGLAPATIAIALSAWRGCYRWLGQQGLVSANPVEGVRAPKGGKPLPKALSVDHAVALAEHRAEGGNAVLAARDGCIVELLYGCGLRVAELVGLDLRASGAAAGWIDAGDA
ncbi:MAG: site-specific integrase, partial [Caldimonas sp.]